MQLNAINLALKGGQKMPSIELGTILSTFEGHNLFSIYCDKIEVYEAIDDKLK